MIYLTAILFPISSIVVGILVLRALFRFVAEIRRDILQSDTP